MLSTYRVCIHLMGRIRSQIAGFTRSFFTVTTLRPPFCYAPTHTHAHKHIQHIHITHTHTRTHARTVHTYSTYLYIQISFDFNYDLLTNFSSYLHAFCAYSSVKVLYLPRTLKALTSSSSNQIPATVQWRGPISDNAIAACLSGCTYVRTLVRETIQSCMYVSLVLKL